MNKTNIKENEFLSQRLDVLNENSGNIIKTVEKLAINNDFYVEHHNEDYSNKNHIEVITFGGSLHVIVDSGYAHFHVNYKTKDHDTFNNNKFIMFVFYLISKYKVKGFVNGEWNEKKYKFKISNGEIEKFIDIIDRDSYENTYKLYGNPYLENVLSHMILGYKINNKLELLHKSKDDDEKEFIKYELKELTKQQESIVVVKEV